MGGCGYWVEVGVCLVEVIRKNELNPEGGGRIFPRNIGVAKRL